MTTKSKTADFLDRAIALSGLSQREIAKYAGFPKPNVISMMKKGETKVPIERIPALATACGVDARNFLITAMMEYHPEAWDVLKGVLGPPLSEAEKQLLLFYNLANWDDDLVLDEAALDAINAVFDLARARKSQKTQP